MSFFLFALFFFTDTATTEKSIFVFAAFDSFRQLIEPVHIAAAEDDIIGNKRFLQLHNCENHFPFPFFFAKSFDSRNPKKIFNDVAIAVREIAELQREKHFFECERGAEPSSKPEKKHSVAVITS